MKVGTFEKLALTEARKAARETLAKVELGSDPSERRRGTTAGCADLGAVIESYLEAKSRRYAEHVSWNAALFDRTLHQASA